MHKSWTNPLATTIGPGSTAERLAMAIAKGDIVALLVILVLLGAGYSLLTTSPAPVRQFELTAVWTTLGLIAAALLTSAPPAITLPCVILLAAPLWYMTIRVSDAQTRSETADTVAVWRHWLATTGAHQQGLTGSDGIGGLTRPATLVQRLDGMGHGDVIEEIEITAVPEGLLNDPLIEVRVDPLRQQLPGPIAAADLELAPVEDSPAWQRRRM